MSKYVINCFYAYPQSNFWKVDNSCPTLAKSLVHYNVEFDVFGRATILSGRSSIIGISETRKLQKQYFQTLYSFRFWYYDFPQLHEATNNLLSNNCSSINENLGGKFSLLTDQRKGCFQEKYLYTDFWGFTRDYIDWVVILAEFYIVVENASQFQERALLKMLMLRSASKGEENGYSIVFFFSFFFYNCPGGK